MSDRHEWVADALRSLGGNRGGLLWFGPDRQTGSELATPCHPLTQERTESVRFTYVAKETQCQ